MAASALFGAVVTVVLRRDPGNVLGVLVVAGTVVACLAVQPRSVRLIIPAPTMCYVPAAMIAGAVHDRATDTSHTMDLLNAGSWIANGFLMMALATVVAIVFTALRLFFYWHYRPQPRRYPRPGPLPVGDDWDATRRMGPEPTDTGRTAPVGQGGWDQTRPINSDTATGPYGPPSQGSGPYRSQDTTSHRPQDAAPSRPQDAAPSRPQIAGPSRPQGSGPYQVQDSSSPRSQDSGAHRSQDSGSYRSQGSGPARQLDTGSYRPQNGGRPEGTSPYRTQRADRPADSGAYPARGAVQRRAIAPAPTPDSGPHLAQGSGAYQTQEPYPSGPYPEAAELSPAPQEYFRTVRVLPRREGTCRRAAKVLADVPFGRCGPLRLVLVCGMCLTWREYPRPLHQLPGPCTIFPALAPVLASS